MLANFVKCVSMFTVTWASCLLDHKGRPRLFTSLRRCLIQQLPASLSSFKYHLFIFHFLLYKFRKTDPPLETNIVKKSFRQNILPQKTFLCLFCIFIAVKLKGFTIMFCPVNLLQQVLFPSVPP